MSDEVHGDKIELHEEASGGVEAEPVKQGDGSDDTHVSESQEQQGAGTDTGPSTGDATQEGGSSPA